MYGTDKRRLSAAQTGQVDGMRALPVSPQAPEDLIVKQQLTWHLCSVASSRLYHFRLARALSDLVHAYA